MAWQSKRELRDLLSERTYQLERARNELADQRERTDLSDQRVQELTMQLGDRTSQRVEQERSIRLELVKDSPYGSLQEIARRAEFVVTGTVAPQAELGVNVNEGLGDAIGKAELMVEQVEQDGPRWPEIQRDALLGAITELAYVAKRTAALRADRSVTVGSVRIQTIDTRLQGILNDLRRIANGSV